MAKKKAKPVAYPFRWEPPFKATRLNFDLRKGEIRVPQLREKPPFYAYTFPRFRLGVLGYAAELELEPNETGTFRIPWFEVKRGIRWYCRGSILERIGRPQEQMLYIICDTKENIGVVYQPPAGWTFRGR